MRGKGRGDMVRARAIVMVKALQEADLSRDELIARVIAEAGNDAYGESPEDTFDRDRRYLAELGFDLQYNRQANIYHLDRLTPLLRLPLSGSDGRLLALIREAFRQTPYAADVDSLVTRITAHLSPEAQAAAASDPILTVVLASADSLGPNAASLEKVQQAIHKQQALEFDYRSSRAQGLKPHVVQPYDSLEFREGHLYFSAHSLLTGYDYEYRVDRIEPGTARLRPQKLAERRRQRQPLTLRYRLSARVASYGASRRFPKHAEERLPNGDVIVTAQIDREALFWASKILLKYGENCEVLEPPELVVEMKRVAAEMGQTYGV